MPKKIRPTSSGTSSTPSALPSTLSDGGALPSLIAFDLDYTLWPFWVDTHVTPPLKATKDYNHVHDRYNDSWHFYPDVPGILYGLRARKIQIAACSRTHAPELAREMLGLLVLDITPFAQDGATVDGKDDTGDGYKNTMRGIDFFDTMEIYPGSKTTHFRSLQRKTGVEYSDMLFFDDEARNRNVERELGVQMILVPDGTNNAVFDKGVMAWRKRQGKTAAQVKEEDGRIDSDDDGDGDGDDE